MGVERRCEHMTMEADGSKRALLCWSLRQVNVFGFFVVLFCLLVLKSLEII